jgi:hypothetical protein
MSRPDTQPVSVETRDRQRHGRDRGAFGAAAMMLSLVTLAGAALVVDGGRAMAARRHAANTAEAAARAGLSSYAPGTGIDPRAALRAALDHTRRAGVAVGDASAWFTTDAAGRPELVVSVTARRNSVFLLLAGTEEMTVRATGSAIALYTP